MFFPKGKYHKNDPDRPKLKPEMAPIDWLLEIFALCALAFLAGYTVYWYSRLPEVIPTHFNFKGEVDDYGNRSELWFLPAIGLFIYVLMTLIALVPHTFNFPWKITPQNALRQYRLAIRMIRTLKLTLVLLFTAIVHNMVRSALTHGLEMSWWFMPFFMAAVFLPVIIYMVVASRK